MVPSQGWWVVGGAAKCNPGGCSGAHPPLRWMAAAHCALAVVGAGGGLAESSDLEPIPGPEWLAGGLSGVIRRRT